MIAKNVEKFIGGQIARIGKERGLTQSELAELIDVTVETISRLERGVSIPSLKTLPNISNSPLKDIFDLSILQSLKHLQLKKQA